MKQLFLCGGVPWKADKNNTLAYALKTHQNAALNVAFCGFARSEGEMSATEKEQQHVFIRLSGNKNCLFKIMTPENFAEVSAWADVIHMPGGDPAKLLYELNKHQNLDRLWDDKIISGSSAGADVVCTNYVHLQSKSIGEGLRWIKATCIPHWGNYEGYAEEDWEEIREMALKRRPDLPVLCIPEGQFVEFAVQ